MSTTSSSASKPSAGWQPPTLEEMQAMLPQYQFVSLLGRGGMGAVYKAVQVSLDRPVAIKVLPVDLVDDEDSQFAERFKNEARTMAKMNHPSIVDVFDFGETQTGLLYIVMEFIDGTDVSKMISSQGKLPEDYALSITAHVCDALAYAHKSGIIHRDIKPANILINMDGAVKVADFGLAKASDAGQSGLTKTNMAMGTPDFVAPEALIPGIPLDGRADLYAIGVMLYQMLTGEIPRGIWSLPGTKLGTDPRFDGIITKAMQTDREVRYQTAAEIRQELDVILTTPRSVLIQQQQAAAEATARATQAQRQAASGPQKPMASGPQKRNPEQPVRNAPPLAKQSNGGLLIGIAATVILGAGLIFFLFSKEPKLVPKSNDSISTKSPGTDKSKSQARQNDTPAPVATSTPPTPMPADGALVFNGHRYRLVKGLRSWADAKSAAEALGGHLATINSKEEADWINANIIPLLNDGSGARRFWLGGARVPGDAKWTWITGEPFSTILWIGKPAAPAASEAEGLVWGALTPNWEASAQTSSIGSLLVEWSDAASSMPVVAVSPLAPPPLSSRPGTINLLAGLDVAKNKRQGDWKLVNGELISDTRASESEITLPVASVPAEYDLRYHLTRIDGFQMQFRFGAGQRNANFITDGWTGSKKSSDEVEAKWGGPKPGAIIRPTPLLRDGKPHELVMQVRKDHIIALLDGREVIRRDSGTAASAPPDFSIRVARGKVIFHAIEIIPITSSTAVADAGKGFTPPTIASTSPSMPATPSPALGVPVNLLALVDVKRDAVVGPWEMTPEGLELKWEKGRAVNVLEFNHSAPEEYDFEIEFTIKKGLSDVSQLLSVTGRAVRWKMGHGFVPLYSFGPFLDGKKAEDPERSEAIVKRPHLKVGQRYRSTVEVRKGSLRALIDGEEVLRWSGDLNRLGDEGSTKVRDGTHLGLGSYSAFVIFHKAELRPASPRSGDIPVAATPSPAGAAPPTPAVANVPPAMNSPPATPPTVAVETQAADFKSGAVHTFGGHRYQLINEELLWEEAKAKAESMGGHLATITSKEERDWLHQSLSPLKGACTHVFLGGYRAPEGGPWSWITGEPFDMALWPGNPPTTTTDTHLAYYVGPSGWDDTPPRMKAPLLVEWDRAELLAAHPQLVKLETGFRSRYDTDAQKPFLTGLATLNQSYLTNGIARARSAAQAKGSLAEVTALDAEKAALEKGEGVPIEDADSTPAALKTLRGTYRTALAKITAERDAKAAPLYDLYLKALDAYIADLTKTSKVSEAKHVSALRDEIAQQKPQTVAAPVAATKPVTTPNVAPTAPPPATTPSLSTGGSSWRNAALFLINNGGSCQVVQNGAGTRVAAEQDIPSGRFDITEIDLNRQNSLLPPLKTEDLGPLNSLRELQRFHLRAGKPGIEDAAFAFLAYNGELKWLNLEGVPDVTDGVLTHIAPLKKLDYLAIQYAAKFTGQGLDKIAGTDSITNLELPSCGITDEGMKAIGSFKKLRNLRINSTGVTPAGFAALTGNRTLTSLNFSGTAIDDEAAGVLASMPSLMNLDLGNTKLTDAGLAMLKSLKKLTNLTLRGTAVSVEAAADFQKALPQCRVNR